MESIEFVLPGNKEARDLIATLNSTLAQITGNKRGGSVFEENFDPRTDAFALVKLDGEPVACGGLRYVEESRCELKRVFSKQKGFGNKVLSALEARAAELGYREIVVATRRTNQSAIEFYLKREYVETAPFGTYSDPGRSICLKKIFSHRPERVG